MSANGYEGLGGRESEGDWAVGSQAWLEGRRRGQGGKGDRARAGAGSPQPGRGGGWLGGSVRRARGSVALGRLSLDSSRFKGLAEYPLTSFTQIPMKTIYCLRFAFFTLAPSVSRCFETLSILHHQFGVFTVSCISLLWLWLFP